MTDNKLKRAGLDCLDNSFRPSDVLVAQMENNRDFIETMLENADANSKHSKAQKGNNDD
ncbi:hypothetical protein SeSz1_47 [Salmonella phage SeSz-1]|uniref:Uncharacterized protein n=1 Tax=Salmonella phage SeSz-1 TaxID=2419752 RepID=A0A411BCB2_9CAUD|nr:hypothetical protein HYP72_gp047 [Salmonella phage SeSz-1]AXF41738.1 hypothetical protein LPST94_00176 [Salmonella phage vB_SalM-LPST94]QAX99230.1 hypothetical protein SeSz1_47 [Salmonella phage SeSz-1]